MSKRFIQAGVINIKSFDIDNGLTIKGNPRQDPDEKTRHPDYFQVQVIDIHTPSCLYTKKRRHSRAYGNGAFRFQFGN
jgi:hypothetical protein